MITKHVRTCITHAPNTKATQTRMRACTNTPPCGQNSCCLLKIIHQRWRHAHTNHYTLYLESALNAISMNIARFRYIHSADKSVHACTRTQLRTREPMAEKIAITLSNAHAHTLSHACTHSNIHTHTTDLTH